MLQHLHEKPLLTLAPIVVANENIGDIFSFCSREITKGGNDLFSKRQSQFSYPHVEPLNNSFKAGEVWETTDHDNLASMVVAFIDREEKIQIILQDNNPALPSNVRGRNIFMLSSGEYGKKPAFAFLTKHPALLENYRKYFPGIPFVDATVFAEPVYMPYGKIQPYMKHLIDGHVMGKVCASCGRPGHHHDVFTPQGFGFGGDK